MATIKSYTDIEQSKKLAEILPIESADMGLYYSSNPNAARNQMWVGTKAENANIPCWSLAALLNVLSEIKPQVYTPILFPSEGKWILQFTEYGHGNVCEVSCDNLIDTCYEMIIKYMNLKCCDYDYL